MQQFMKPCNYSLGLKNSKQILHKYEKKNKTRSNQGWKLKTLKIKKNVENLLMCKDNRNFGNLPSCWINCQTNRRASSQRGAIIGNQCFPVLYITMQLQDLRKH